MVKKAIEQFTLDNKFIKKFISAKDAEKETSIDRRLISLAARGDIDSAGDFIWYFDDPDLDNEKKWLDYFVDGIPVRVSDIGRVHVKNSIKTFGSKYGIDDKAQMRIQINRKAYIVARIVWACWNGESVDDMSITDYVLHINKNSCDNKPDNLFISKNCNANQTQNPNAIAEKLSKAIELIKCDSNGQLYYDDNGYEIVLRKYTGRIDASESSDEHTQQKMSKSTITNRCSEWKKHISNPMFCNKKYDGKVIKDIDNNFCIYRHIVTYIPSPREKFILIKDSLNKLPDHYMMRAGETMISNYGNIKDANDRFTTKFHENHSGYGTFNQMFVSRLVAYAFNLNPNPKKFKTVDHRNRNILDNHHTNLVWTDDIGQANNKSTNIIQKKI
tara:strand:+ start:1150 stop:2310 length:1161 start_codon:yes stop_codon:yes gene_type:complete